MKNHSKNFDFNKSVLILLVIFLFNLFSIEKSYGRGGFNPSADDLNYLMQEAQKAGISDPAKFSQLVRESSSAQDFIRRCNDTGIRPMSATVANNTMQIKQVSRAAESNYSNQISPDVACYSKSREVENMIRVGLDNLQWREQNLPRQNFGWCTRFVKFALQSISKYSGQLNHPLALVPGFTRSVVNAAQLKNDLKNTGWVDVSSKYNSFNAPKGAIITYSGGAGHVEMKTVDGDVRQNPDCGCNIWENRSACRSTCYISDYRNGVPNDTPSKNGKSRFAVSGIFIKPMSCAN